MHYLIRSLNHLLLGAILGMIFLALTHASPLTRQVPDRSTLSHACPTLSKLVLESSYLTSVAPRCEVAGNHPLAIRK